MNLTALSTVMENPAWLPPAGVALGLAAAWGKKRLRGKTLVAVWGWGIASLSALAAGEIVVAVQGGTTAAWVGHLRFITAVTTLMPLVSLLGAKRPQNRAWHFVVFTLLVVLSQPALEAQLFHPDQPLLLHPARHWFLAILVLAGLINSLPTRLWPAGTMICAGQACLLAEHLPLVETLTVLRQPTWGGLLWSAGFCCWVWDLPRRRRAGSSFLDRLWLDFRDAYGMLWSLRVQERFNAAVAAQGRPIRLSWSGFCSTQDSPRDKTAEKPIDKSDPVIRQTFFNLLERFISTERLEEPERSEAT